MKLSFKKHPKQTGLAGMVYKPQIDIKADKKKVGLIYPPDFRRERDWYRLAFMVEGEDPGESWKWVYLKARPDTEGEARDYVIQNWERIQADLKLHLMED